MTGHLLVVVVVGRSPMTYRVAPCAGGGAACAVTGCCVGAEAAGSSSSDDDEDVPDVEEEELRALGAGLGTGACSASGSSRDDLLVIGCGGAGRRIPEDEEDLPSMGPA